MKQKLIKIGERLAVAITTFILLMGVGVASNFFLNKLGPTGRIITLVVLAIMVIAMLYRAIAAGETITDKEIVRRIQKDDKYHQYIIATIKEGKDKYLCDISCHTSGDEFGFYYMIKRFVETEPEVGIDILKEVISKYEEKQNSKEDNDYASRLTQEINPSVSARR